MCDLAGKILLVDDDIHHLRSMKYYLEKKFKNVIIDIEKGTADAFITIDRANNDGVPYNAVICDWDFGDEKGEVLEKMLRDSKIKTDFRYMSAFKLSGVNWFSKPIDQYTLFKYLTKTLEDAPPIPQFTIMELLHRTNLAVERTIKTVDRGLIQRGTI